MNNGRPSWYVPGKGKEPAGPFTAEQLIESWKAGRLGANTVCWREGMSQWLPLGAVEPFASVVASAGVARQGAAGPGNRPHRVRVHRPRRLLAADRAAGDARHPR